MNRVIHDSSELDALPVGSVVRSDEDEYGEPIYVRQADAWFCGWGWERPALPPRPVTVLHDPSASAAPSATREDVVAVLCEVMGDAAYDDGTIAHDVENRAADELLARFTITPRTDR